MYVCNAMHIYYVLQLLPNFHNILNTCCHNAEKSHSRFTKNTTVIQHDKNTSTASCISVYKNTW